jgi:hypothetical protein
MRGEFGSSVCEVRSGGFRFAVAGTAWPKKTAEESYISGFLEEFEAHTYRTTERQF